MLTSVSPATSKMRRFWKATLTRLSITFDLTFIIRSNSDLTPMNKGSPSHSQARWRQYNGFDVVLGNTNTLADIIFIDVSIVKILSFDVNVFCWSYFGTLYSTFYLKKLFSVMILPSRTRPSLFDEWSDCSNVSKVSSSSPARKPSWRWREHFETVGRPDRCQTESPWWVADFTVIPFTNKEFNWKIMLPDCLVSSLKVDFLSKPWGEV